MEDLFNDKHTARVLSFLLLHERWEQNQKDLSDELNMYRKTVGKVLKKLEDFGIIKITKTIAKSKFYKINSQSKIVNPLRKLNLELIMLNALKEVENQN